jgi:hypothetical protein
MLQKIKRMMTHNQFSFFLVSLHNTRLNGSLACCLRVDISHSAGIMCVWF